MPRVVSFLVLLAVILLVGAVFFQVMAQFMVPLFLACVLLVMFQPLHRWILRRIPRYPRIAALSTTILIVLLVLVPTVLLGWNAYHEFRALLVTVQADELQQDADPPAAAAPQEQIVERPDAEGDNATASDQVTDRLTKLARNLQDRLKVPEAWQLRDADLKTLIGKATSVAGVAALNIVQGFIGVLVGLFVMVIALYYFFADGPALVRGLMQLSPLDEQYELELLLKFGQISRAVVLATVVSAVAQGVLASIGYYFALPAETPIFLLTALTMVLAIVPFIGAAGLWVPVCLYIALHGVGGEGAAAAGNWPLALGLGIYCAVIVSGSDNVIKPLILHGQSNLHPLLALLSILGGVTVLGPVGILVGPMLVSFLQALLQMFHKELEHWGREGDSPVTKLATATAAATGSIESTAKSSEAGKPAQIAAETPRRKGSGKKKRR